jgi:GxxExxY protein
VDNAVIVDAKVVESFNDSHISQMIGYLKITGLRVGLLINFKHASIQVKRITI